MKAENKKPYFKKVTWVYFSLCLLINAFILAESAVPGGLSANQSNFFGNITAFIVNIFGGNANPTVVQAYEITYDYDSSFLGNQKVAVGSSSRLGFTLHYEEGDAYDQSFEVTRISGTEDDYSLIVNLGGLSNQSLTNYINVVGLKQGDYAFKVSSNEVSYTYEFSVVDLATPTEFIITDLNYNLDIGESCLVPLYLSDSSGVAASRVGVTENTPEDEAREAIDHYLKRIYDPSKINFNIADPEVVKYDNGLLTGLRGGNTTINVGSYTLNVTVNDSSLVTPNSFSLRTSGEVNLQDYDYYDGSSDYGLLVEADFGGSNGNYGVNYSLANNDNIHARIQYLDENRAVILGYRLKGDIQLIATPLYGNLSPQTLDLEVGSATPESFTLNVSANETLSVGSYLYVSASFTPANVSSTALKVVANSNPDIVSISGDGTNSIAIGGLASGEVDLTFASVLDESLTQSLHLTINDRPTINEDNEDEFTYWIRKFGGHFMLFLVEAVIGFLMFYMFFERFKYKAIYASGGSLVVGLAFAFLSELIQLYTPERGASFIDVGIDFAGVAAGVALCLVTLLIIYFVKKYKAKKKEGSTSQNE